MQSIKKANCQAHFSEVYPSVPLKNIFRGKGKEKGER